MTGIHARIRQGNNRAMAHPDHQRKARVRRAAVTDAVTLYGWRLSELGHLGDGVTLGPCARCQRRHERYGPNGRPVCRQCAP